MSTFTPLRPRRLLALLACAAGILAAAFVLATLVLLAMEGHPEGLLAAAAGAVVPVVLWGAWRLIEFVPGIRSATGSRLDRDDVVTSPRPSRQPKLEATTGPTETSETPQSSRPSTESADTEPVEAAAGAGDTFEAVQRFKAENAQHEALWARARHSSFAARNANEAATQALARAQATRLAHLTIEAENPERRAPRLRQLALAGVTVVLDAIGCNFAAQAVGNGHLQTLGWTALFLGVLAGGQLALDHYRDRRPQLWLAIASGLGGFVVGLGVLRYSFLIAGDPDDPLAALLSAALLILAVAGSVAAGYWALRRAETSAASHARRRARKAAKEAKAAAAQAAWRSRERDRLVDAYISRIRTELLRYSSVSRLPKMEAALRILLLSRDPTNGTKQPWPRQDQGPQQGPAKDTDQRDS